MIWFLLAASTALFESIKDAFGKRSAARESPIFIAIAVNGISGTIGAVVAYLVDGPPVFLPGFWQAACPGILINCLAGTLYFRALKEAPLALALPLLKLSPMFLLVTSPFITGEQVSWIGALGVLITVLGTWILGYSGEAKGLFAPFLSLVKNRGTRSMLFVAFLWGITAPLDKVAVLHSSPFWWIATAGLGIALTLSVIAGPSRVVQQFSRPEAMHLLPVGGFLSLALTTQMIAITLAPVPYVIGIKRLSAFFGMLWGALFFGERITGNIFVGALVALCGAILILAS